MIVIDTSALIAILQCEPEQGKFLNILSESHVAIGAPTRFEALLVAARHPHGQQDVRDLLSRIEAETFDWTETLSDVAADAFLRFGKGRHRAHLNFGDCMAYALAKSLDAPLLFKGDDFGKTDVKIAA